MGNGKSIRYIITAILLVLGVWWSLASAQREGAQGYPNADFLATPDWLMAHKNDAALVIVDVRMDEYFKGKVIPGAVRMPWRQFRYNDAAGNMGGLFVGVQRAQEILGEHGIARNDTVVLYDSVERDGGATSSYIFWVLDLLGHGKKRVLERGIDGWIDAGGETAAEPRKPEPVLYQAPSDEIDPRKSASAEYVLQRLGDPYYQILDVRSRDEYLGEAPNTGLDGRVLKLGHIPTAYNLDYARNWVGSETKEIKPYGELQRLYRGLDPDRAVITYCHSARRGSFGYFILRLMGFSDVMLYEPSWMEWGNKQFYYPVETAENVLSGDSLPGASATTASRSGSRSRRDGGSGGGGSGGGGSQDGYVSCGG